MGFYKLKTGPSYKLKTGPSFYCCFPQFYSVFGAFLETQIVSQCVKIVFLQNFGLSKMRFSKRKLHFLFFLFYVGEIETKKRKKKRKWKRPKTLQKKGFLRWSSKNMKNQKKDFFSKNIPDTICVRKGEKTRIFVHTICFGKILFGPKRCKAGKTIKIVVSADIGQNQK